MNTRRNRAARLRLQRDAVPHRHWLRRHEWKRHAPALLTGVVGEVTSIRFITTQGKTP